jgi:Uncharacterized protein conserved in bacteria (DUF2252)
LQEDRRGLLQRYHRRDVAFKTVGVGSVGTFCAIGLFVSDDGAPSFVASKAPWFTVTDDLPQYPAGIPGQNRLEGRRQARPRASDFLASLRSGPLCYDEL